MEGIEQALYAYNLTKIHNLNDISGSNKHIYSPHGMDGNVEACIVCRDGIDVINKYVLF
jgi:hypothetical protein